MSITAEQRERYNAKRRGNVELMKQRREKYKNRTKEQKQHDKEYRRKYYEEHRERCIELSKNNMMKKQNSEEYKPMRRVYNKVQKAIFRGKLIKGKCEVCGSEKTQAHHDDYNKPLEIRWLCKKCHTEWHLNNKPIAIMEEAFNGGKK